MEKATSKSWTPDVATNALPCSCMVTHSNAASFLISNILCENTNILFSKNYWKLGKMNMSNTFKITNITNLTNVIQQYSCRVLQVTSKWKTLKQPVYFLKAIEFWPTFDIQVDITLAIFWLKVAKPHFLESPQKSLKTRYEITAFWKYEKFVFFWWLLFQMKKLLTFGIFNESNIWAKIYHI